MRTVAIAMALLLLPLAAPALAADEYDECKDVFARNPCVDVTTPSAPSPAPATAKRYFLYLGWTKCPPQMDPACTGKPNDNHELPVSFFGALYEDTNRLGGLQRHTLRLSETVVYPPDHIVLL